MRRLAVLPSLLSSPRLHDFPRIRQQYHVLASREVVPTAWGVSAYIATIACGSQLGEGICAKTRGTPRSTYRIDSTTNYPYTLPQREA
jgi:hypothetical protein